MNFTPLEEQVLQVMEEMTIMYSYLPSFYTDYIAANGRRKFGDSWAGGAIKPNSRCLASAYPVLNRFLGRLYNKGLVEREESLLALSMNRGYGSWALTAQGRELAGLTPTNMAHVHN